MAENFETLLHLLTLFYEAGKIPLVLRLLGEETRTWPKEGALLDAPFDQLLSPGTDEALPCLISLFGSVYIARLPLKEGVLFAGPIPAKPPGEALLRALAVRFQIPSAKRRAFRRMLSLVPVLDQARCRAMLAFLSAALSGAFPDAARIPLIEQTKEGLSKEGMRDLSRPVQSPVADMPLYELIREGDAFTLQELLRIRERGAPPDREEDAGNGCQRSAMRFLAQAGYAAIQGGIPREQAQDLVSGFLKQARMVRDEMHYRELVRSVTETFCERVREQKRAGSGSPLTDRIVAYVSDHLFEPLSVRRIADQLHFHASYVSSAFYDGNGVHLKAYIISRKLEQACRLLKYSDRSLSEISSLLSYTDQSHFQKTFRAHLGITPDQYRRQNAGLY